MNEVLLSNMRHWFTYTKKARYLGRIWTEVTRCQVMVDSWNFCLTSQVVKIHKLLSLKYRFCFRCITILREISWPLRNLSILSGLGAYFMTKPTVAWKIHFSLSKSTYRYNSLWILEIYLMHSSFFYNRQTKKHWTAMQ